MKRKEKVADSTVNAASTSRRKNFFSSSDDDEWWRNWGELINQNK
jgi:hypothetical protein